MADITSPPGMAGDIPPKIEQDEAPKVEKVEDVAPRVLTPPTSEDMGSKHDGNSSELSDLEDDEDDDDIGDVFPDHYWDGENGGKIPVFKPVRRMPTRRTVAAAQAGHAHYPKPPGFNAHFA
jgi:hypothetical protein